MNTTQPPFTCANCHKEIPQLKAITSGTVPSKGDLILCGNCAHVNVVWVESVILNTLKLRLLLQTEYDALSSEEKKDLLFAVRNIIAQGKRNKSQIELPPWFR